MRTLIWPVLALMAVLLFPQTSSAQFACGTVPDTTESQQKALPALNTATHCDVETGVHIPSLDTLYINIVFAQFADDTTTVEGWPAGEFPPFIFDFIDSTATVGSTHRLNVTNYFRTFSDGQYIVLGRVDTITVYKSMHHPDHLNYGYFTNSINANSTAFHILKNRLGFFVYDRWNHGISPWSNDCYTKSADGEADLVSVIWRNSRFSEQSNSSVGGYVGGILNFGSYELPGEVDSVKTPDYSGMTVMPFSKINKMTINLHFNIFIHEFGHLLIQGRHSHIQRVEQYRGTHLLPSLLSEHLIRSIVPNPLELEKLGWKEPDYIISAPSTSSLTLSDYETTLSYAKYIHTTSGNSLYFFNVGRSGTYDELNHNDEDKGLFVMHHKISNLSAYTSNIDSHNWTNKMISSEGDYDWEQVNPYFHDASHPFLTGIFARVRPNPATGRSHLTMLQRNDPCAAINQVQWLGALGDVSRQGVAPSNLTGCYSTSHPYAFADTSFNFTGRGFRSAFSYENNRAYMSNITNPMFKEFQSIQSGGSLSSMNPLPISMHLGPTQSNGSIPVTFRFNEDPFTITTNRVWSGEIFIPDSVSVVVSNNATLTILPDTRIYLGKGNARITTTGGGKIIAVGTQQKPITFTTRFDTDNWNPADEWGQIFLGSGGNRFQWCVFEYGTKHIEVASRDNEIRNSIFRKGWRGLSSYSNQSGSGPTNSELLLDHVLITENRTVGYVGYFTDSRISNVTITRNGEAGAWYQYANGLSVHHSRIDSNGTVSASRSGVESHAGSVVHLMRYVNGSYVAGRNTIRHQPQCQIYRGSSSTLHLGNYYTLGDGGWSNVAGGSSYLVRNYGTGWLYAHENYWGTSDPTSSDFLGSVDFDFYMGEAANVYQAGSLPIESHYYRDQHLKITSGGLTADIPVDIQAAEGRDRLRRLNDELRVKVESGTASEAEINRFIDLTTSLWDDTWHARDRERNTSILDGLFQKLVSRGTRAPADVRVLEFGLRNRVFSDRADARRTADQVLDRFEAPDIRLAAHQARFVLFEQAGDLQSARQEIDRIRETIRVLDYPESDITNQVGMMLTLLDQRPEPEFLFGSDQSSEKVFVTPTSEQEAPTLTTYPNPFNPEIRITVDVRTQGPVRVEIFNTLGQLVTVLSDGPLTVGRHSVRFDGSHLASGMYLVRVRSAGHVLTERITLIK